jgi:single-strand DNA-binding protein
MAAVASALGRIIRHYCGRRDAGRIAAGIHSTEWQDAEGKDRYGCTVGGDERFP